MNLEVQSFFMSMIKKMRGLLCKKALRLIIANINYN